MTTTETVVIVAKSCLTLCDPMDCSMPGSSVLYCLPEFTHHLILCHPFSYCLQPLREPVVKEMAERGLEILLINLRLPGLEAPRSYHGNLVDLASTAWFSNSLCLRISSIKIVMDRLLDAIIAWLLWLLGDISWGNNLILLVDDYASIFYILLSSVQSLSCVQLFGTAWTAARLVSLSITNSWSLLKLISIKSVMLSNHLILCHPLLLLPSIFPRIRVVSSESVLCIRWPRYWSFISNCQKS